MAIRKSDLYRSLWEQCDALRGSMDASQYKDYILALLFVKYVSDRKDTQGSLLDVPEGGSFEDLVALVGTKDIGDGINKVLSKLAEANDLVGVIDLADFNDESKLGRGKDMVDRLSDLVKVFAKPELDFSGNSAEGDDLLGDAYEYLMRHFATESGKSKGQFYTPAEVSRVMARLIGLESASSASQTIYDPTAGSGSLLLKAHAEAKNATGLDLTIYGQEMDNATAALAKMNMILHGSATAEVHQGNTLADPHFHDASDANKLKKFDYIVANPPFSTKNWKTGFTPEADLYGRFPYGLPPAKNGDFAFLLHILASLKSTGKSATILPHGVLFRGGAEAAIRKELVKQHFIRAVVGLPANLFYGTGIPAAIIVMDKEAAGSRTGIFMVDASRGFAKDGAKNRLRERDIHQIVDSVRAQEEIPGYSRLVPYAEILDPANDCNLNIARYIAPGVKADVHDVQAHLFGGIPNRDLDALSDYWEAMPSLRGELFTNASSPGYSDFRIAPNDLVDVIAAHPEYVVVREVGEQAVRDWMSNLKSSIAAIDSKSRPKRLVHALSEELLAAAQDAPLVDPYALYESFMEYWSETLRDDLTLIVDQGWLAAAQLRSPRVGKDKNNKDKVVERVDVERGVGRSKEKFRSDLLPAESIVLSCLVEEQAAVDASEAEVARAKAELDAFVEEHDADEGLLNGTLAESEAESKRAVKQRIAEIDSEPEFAEELALLREWQDLLAAVDGAKKAVKESKLALTEAMLAVFDTLTEERVRDLAWQKWERDLQQRLYGQLFDADDLSVRLVGLNKRYETPLGQLEERVAELSSRVSGLLTEVVSSP